jgi:hypothetical protein
MKEANDPNLRIKGEGTEGTAITWTPANWIIASTGKALFDWAQNTGANHFRT